MKKSCVLLISALLFGSLTYFKINEPERGHEKIISKEEILAFISKRQNAKPIDEDLVFFGEKLFFDTRLSGTNTISCATCHRPDKAWTDGKEKAVGIEEGSRNTPSIYNLASNRWFFWDGRADALWAQALGPIESPHEMGNNRVNVLRFVFEDNELDSLYRDAFKDSASRFVLSLPKSQLRNNEKAQGLFDSMPDQQKYAINSSFSNIGKAIAEFEKSITSVNSKFDSFCSEILQDYTKSKILDTREILGLQLFLGKGNCSLCHSGFNLSDGEFHYIRLRQDTSALDPGRLKGIQNLKESEWSSLGRFSNDDNSGLTKNLKESPLTTWGSFKTPSLRNVSLTAPYMHDGRFNTLEEVIDHYSELTHAGPSNRYGESIIEPLSLTDYEKKCVIAFLRTLEDNQVGEKMKSLVK